MIARSLASVALLALASCQTMPGEDARAAGDDSWTEIAPADGSQPGKHSESSFARVGSDLVLIGGRGNPATHIFSLESCSWREGSAAPFQVHHFQAIALDGDVYVVGALTNPFRSEYGVEHVMIYNVASDSWRQGPEIPEARRRGAAAAVLVGEWIYLLNGNTNGHRGGFVNWADRMHVRSGKWEQLADSPHARDHVGAVHMDGKIIVAGGRRSGPPNVFQDVEPAIDVYDIASNSWSTAANLPTTRAGVASAQYRGLAVTMGGESGASDKAHAEVEGYSLATGLAQLPALPIPRHGFGAAMASENDSDAVYVAGGVPTRGGGDGVLQLHRLGTSPGPCG